MRTVYAMRESRKESAASRATLAAVMALCAAAGCHASPSTVFEKMEEAARGGKSKEFASYFTEDSRPFAEALLSLHRSQAPAVGSLSRPLELLTRATVKDEKVEDAVAKLTVKTATGEGTLVFVKDDHGDWKLDVQQTERQNAEKSL